MQSSHSKILRRFTLVAFLAALALSVTQSHQASGKVDFRRDVQPIFKQFCIECHGPSIQQHGFRLDRRRDAMRGGTQTMIVPGSSAMSRLYLKLISNKFGPQMPLNERLTDDQIEIIKRWIDEGAEWPDDLAGDVSPPPPDPKAEPILKALRDGDKQTFKKLVGENKNAGNLRGAGGTTPLMQAALYGDAEDVRWLLEHGADPNIRNDAGATALMWAVDDLQKTRLLIEHGADVNARSDDARTPLLIATGLFGNTEVVKLLLDRGADLTAKSPDTRGYATVLLEAARTGDESLLRLLIERGADVKSAGAGALFHAARSDCAKCLELLINGTDRRTLTQAGAVLSPPTWDGRVVNLLLDKGVDANTREPKGNTLLMLAAASDAVSVDTIKALIERGADVNAKNPDGKTPLDFARMRGPNPIADMLAKAGAKEGTAAIYTPPAPKPAASIRAALERSLPLLQKADAIFLQRSGCVSCHHNTFTAMTVALARKNGFKVNEQAANEQHKKIGEYLEKWRERVLQGVGIPGETNAISYILTGLAAENYPPDAATDTMARFIASQQRPNGQWRVFAHRPPLGTSDIALTSLALRAIQVYAPKAERAKYEAAVKRAADWLMKANPQTTDDRVYQLMGLAWSGVKADSEFIKKGARELIAQQRADGGWAQLPSLASDAYATGLALVALRQAGAIQASDPAFKRGIEFLLKTQLEDGSWYVRSRSVPLQPYFEGGFPHGNDQWISAAATNWAAMALALTNDSQRGKYQAKAR
ncbi:MAG TPA: ankyrin repeat domain-containing protein [Blastocatellia bacterium]|nr:ankyrin repeat domain-containing protein [Blastocatellia bacterium]